MKSLIAICAMMGLFATDYANAGTWTTLPTIPWGIDGSNITVGDGFYNLATGMKTSVQFPGTGLCNTGSYDIDGSTVVGYYTVGGGPAAELGFIYNNGEYTTLYYPGSTEVFACGVSGSNVVGLVYDSSLNEHGFLYNNGNWTILDYPGASDTATFGISGNSVVGAYGTHSFIYNSNTGDWATLDYPGAKSTCAFAIDGSNIVGVYLDGSNIYHGFLYNGGAWTSLDYPWGHYNTNTYVTGISGNTIVGDYYDNGNNFGGGFLYTIPEPATLLILGLGGMVLRKRKA